MFSSMRRIITESLTVGNSVLQLTSNSVSLSNQPMKTCDELRLENLLALIDEAGGEDALAKRYECTAAYIKQMARGYKDSKSGTIKGIGDSSARRLEICMGKDRGWIDHDHTISDYAIEAASLISTLHKNEQIELLHHLRFQAKKRAHLNELPGQLAPDDDSADQAPQSH